MLERFRARWWRLTERAAAEDGLTLIEILIAGFVLTVAVLALASVASASLVSVRDSRERDRGTAAASTALESVRALDYDEIAMQTGGSWTDGDEDLVQQSGDDYYLDHNGDGQATERIWHTPAGPIEPHLCTSETDDCWFEPPSSTEVTVRVFVTWYPEPDDYTGKRITAVATWDEPSFDAPRTVRMSTVISPASRGLPAPAFEVLPDFLNHTYDHVAVLTQYERCFPHTLNNYGARDSYDVVPGESSDGWTAGTTSWTWTGQGGKQWHFRAELIPDDIDENHPDYDDRHMLPGGTESLASSFELETGDSARLNLCYTPGTGEGAPAHEDVFEFTPRVRSQFDPDVQEEVTHLIDVEWNTFLLYPHYHPRVDDGSLLRPIRTRADVELDVSLDGASLATNVALFDQFPMNESFPPSRSSLPNYDVGLQYLDDESADITPTGWIGALDSGLYLPPNIVRVEDFMDEIGGVISDLLGPLLPVVGDLTIEDIIDLLELREIDIDGVPQPGELFAAEWDYQFPSEVAPLTLGGTSTLRFWSSYSPSETRATPANGRVCFRAQLIHNPAADEVVVAEGQLMAGATPNWVERQLTLDWADDVTFATGDYLRLRLWIDGTMISVAELQDGRHCVGTNIAFGADVTSQNRYVATLTSTPQ